MGKNTTLDVPPPGAGLVTVTDAVLAFATSEALTKVFSSLLEMTSVALSEPFQLTTAVGANPVPLTVTMKPLLPGWALAGTKG